MDHPQSSVLSATQILFLTVQTADFRIDALIILTSILEKN